MKRILLPALVFSLVFTACRIPSAYYKTETLFYEPGKQQAIISDSIMEMEILPYQQKLNSLVDRVIGFSEIKMQKGKPESLLGNFTADLALYLARKKYNKPGAAPPDFCVLNNGGLRSALPEGKITVKNIFELMPFENELVVITLSGDSVRSLLKYISAAGGVPVSNIKMNLTDTMLANTYIDGSLFTTSRNYKIVTSDYLAEGGDKMVMFMGAVTTERINLKLRDAIIEYIEELSLSGKNISSALDGRISN
jgi:2',3'-cyclic-nucleotide 2'-phosphodiesterase (5'-nucleotidase family)